MNITTAGVCTKCGWSQFTKSTVSTCVSKTIGEIELKVSGKALLDDYKRLLLENRNLKERVAKLEEAQRWTKGGDGSHWEGCEDVHWDCKIVQLEAELKITDELLKEATETIGAVVACCTYNSNDDAKIIYEWTPEEREDSE